MPVCHAAAYSGLKQGQETDCEHQSSLQESTEILRKQKCPLRPVDVLLPGFLSHWSQVITIRGNTGVIISCF